jgi:hypothetical protein
MNAQAMLAGVLIWSAANGLALAQAGDAPTTGQCTCREGTDGRHGEFVATIDNAHLCISTPVQNGRPMCRITVHCLSDGTGPGCPAREQAIAAAGSVRSGDQDLTDEIGNFTEALQTSFTVSRDIYRQPLPTDHQQLANVLRDTANSQALRSCLYMFGTAETEAVSHEGRSLRCHYRPETRNLAIEVPVTWDAASSVASVTIQIVSPE